MYYTYHILVPLVTLVNILVSKMSLGERLKEERERLGFNQIDFAKIVGASRKTQIRWEKDESAPGADALEMWAKIGLDVLYVVVGQKTKIPPCSDEVPKMTSQKQTLMDAYDEMDTRQREYLIELSQIFTQSATDKDILG